MLYMKRKHKIHFPLTLLVLCFRISRNYSFLIPSPCNFHTEHQIQISQKIDPCDNLLHKLHLSQYVLQQRRCKRYKIGTASSTTQIHASSNTEQEEVEDGNARTKINKPTKGGRRKRPTSQQKSSMTKRDREKEKAKKKEEIMRQLRNRLNSEQQKPQAQTRNTNGGSEGSSAASGLLDKLNPFQVGQNLRQTLGSLTSIGSGLNEETKQKYYLDDRFLESSGGVLSERSPYLEQEENSANAPEVLVIGATGEVGRLIVQRLLLEGRCRVRVLVQDLYSQTLNMLGTGVTYCQGDLTDPESLEYAVTDVDKIVFCASAPRPDEPDFQERFQSFMKENSGSKLQTSKREKASDNLEWEQLNSILELRAQLAEQVDFVGMKNLVRAYQNVRHADYGTSQAAKRSVFKFSSRAEDFRLFSLDEDTVEFLADKIISEEEQIETQTYQEYGDDTCAEDDDGEYDGEAYLEDEEDYYDVESRRDATIKSQIQWTRNEFGHGVFVGKVPKVDSSGMGGEAAIVSSRLRSREDPDRGIDLSGDFAGFILRLLGDGSNYEAFVRTGEYENTGFEYVCEFSTTTKPTSKESKSRNKFSTIRLPFENFKPVVRNEKSTLSKVPPFIGNDVQYIGFRYRSGSNQKQNEVQKGSNVGFYMAMSYVKVYRLQPEPEFVFLSDARIPPVVKNGMIRHNQRRLVLQSEESPDQSNDYIEILDEATLQKVTSSERSPEEIYYRFRGEEVLKGSGLSYTIIRVAGYNESPSGEASTIDLMETNSRVSPVSRAEAAQVCVNALLNPDALNKSVYVGKRKGTARDEDISRKFAALPSDATY